MKALENLFVLSHKLTVYVPATVNINQQIDNTTYVNSTAELLSNLFGGATSSAAIGYWMSDTAGLVRENTTVVFAFAKDLEDEGLKIIVEHCKTMKKELSQDAIALEIDGKMYFV